MQAGKPKTVTPTKPKAPGKLLSLVMDAIKVLKNRKGSSVPAIMSFVKVMSYEYGEKENLRKLVTNAIKRGLANGQLEQIKMSYKLSKTEVKSIQAMKKKAEKKELDKKKSDEAKKRPPKNSAARSTGANKKQPPKMKKTMEAKKVKATGKKSTIGAAAVKIGGGRGGAGDAKTKAKPKAAAGKIQMAAATNKSKAAKNLKNKGGR